MQLTHQAKTKKKYTTKHLLATFGFNQIEEKPIVVAQLLTPDASSIIASSDAEVNQVHGAPPTNPHSDGDGSGKDGAARTTKAPQKQPTSPHITKMDKSKGRTPEFQHLPPYPLVPQAQPVTVRRSQIESKKPMADWMIELSD